MKIYIAGAISGQSTHGVFTYFKQTAYLLQGLGYIVYSPLIGKDKLFRNEVEFKAEGYDSNPRITNHAIIERDRWMVQQSDILYCNLTMSKEIVSIGSMMELAWAHHLGKHTIVVMQADNIHRHAFVIEAADVIFETEREGLEYLRELSLIGRKKDES
jgi:nucleoside 2-deoxyribosyltransferase